MRFTTLRGWIFTPILVLLAGGLLTACQSQDAQPELQPAEPAVAATSSEMPDAGVPQGENNDVPEGWNVRLDRPDASTVIGSSEDDDVYFVNMTPGWHVTTSKAGIFYHPAVRTRPPTSPSVPRFSFSIRDLGSMRRMASSSAGPIWRANRRSTPTSCSGTRVSSWSRNGWATARKLFRTGLHPMRLTPSRLARKSPL